MSMMNSPVSLVRAKSPSMLYALVMDEIVRGFSLAKPLFIGNDGFLSQWVEEGNDCLDYVLIDALTGAELEHKVRKMVSDGYYMVFETVVFVHGYLQWMARNKAFLVKAEKLSVVSDQLIDKLTMVEGAQSVLRLAPVVSFDVAVSFVREVVS